MNYICNIKKSQFDKMDYEYIGSKNNNIKIPEILDYRPELQPIRNQGKQGSCYAQCVACVKEWQEKKDYGFNQYFSPQFFYNNRTNKYDENKNNDDGMNGRDVMKLMMKIGICSEESYPYGKIENKNNITDEVYNEAKNHIIKGYARVYNMDNLKKCLFNNGPCFITFPVYNFENDFWKKTGKKIGGHAVTIIGYNKDGFIIRNSWGRKYGNDGYWLYKYSDWNSHSEIWTTIDDKSKYIKYEDKKQCCYIS
tara:strand:+ start:1180 stop:1935 length:756 start_codon:yes stop_codon:yes gene_type:complete